MIRRGIKTIITWTLLVLAGSLPSAGAAAIATVIQAHRAFGPDMLSVAVGSQVAFHNDDPFNHQVFIKSPAFSFESAEQVPGETISVTFSKAGQFDVLCAIHPRMHLAVTVR